MKRRLVWMAVVFFVLVLIGGTVHAQSTNLLQNGGFEGAFQPFEGNSSITVAEGWKPWWVYQDVHDPDWRNRTPAFEQATSSNRVHSGSSAQQYSTAFGTHTAGIYQQVSGRTPGEQLRFSIWAYAWSSSYDEECCSVDNGFVDLRIGIDPYGGLNPFSTNVVWSSPEQYYDSWGQLEVDAVAASDTVTVFFWSAPLYPVKHNNIYIDDAELTVAGQATPPTSPSPAPIVAETAVVTTSPTAETSPAPSPTSETATVTPATPGPGTQTPSGETGTVYVVQRGDTLGAIAARFGITVEELAAVNGIDNPNLIIIGQQLVIPGTETGTAAVEGETAIYVVAPGDTLSAIAVRYNTTVGTLASLNGIVNVDRIRVGQELRVPSAAATGAPAPAATPVPTATPAAGAPRGHTVQAGENLFRIALRYSVTVDSIAALNRLADVSRIYVGQELLIP
jgi:LysM repeat protein